ncbi:MAG TPA: hypothetical protein VIM05_08335 [Gaiellaceae bacterium]
MKPQTFQVDISDPSAIAASLKEVEEEVLKRRDALKRSVEELDHWETLYLRLAALSGRGDQTRAVGRSYRTQILEIVNGSEVPITVDRLMQLIPGIKRKTASWNLWDLERKGDIQRVTEGVYARLDFKPATLIDAE